MVSSIVLIFLHMCITISERSKIEKSIQLTNSFILFHSRKSLFPVDQLIANIISPILIIAEFGFQEIRKENQS